MAQTKDGAKKAVFSLREKYGDDYFKVIGSKGGAKSTGKTGFALDRKRAAMAGKKSKKNKIKKSV